MAIHSSRQRTSQTHCPSSGLPTHNACSALLWSGARHDGVSCGMQGARCPQVGGNHHPALVDKCRREGRAQRCGLAPQVQEQTGWHSFP